MTTAIFETTFGNKGTIKCLQVFLSEHNHSDTHTNNTIGSPSIVQCTNQSDISEDEGFKFPYTITLVLCDKPLIPRHTIKV